MKTQLKKIPVTLYSTLIKDAKSLIQSGAMDVPETLKAAASTLANKYHLAPCNVPIVIELFRGVYNR